MNIPLIMILKTSNSWSPVFMADALAVQFQYDDPARKDIPDRVINSPTSFLDHKAAERQAEDLILDALYAVFRMGSPSSPAALQADLHAKVRVNDAIMSYRLQQAEASLVPDGSEEDADHPEKNPQGQEIDPRVDPLKSSGGESQAGQKDQDDMKNIHNESLDERQRPAQGPEYPHG